MTPTPPAPDDQPSAQTGALIARHTLGEWSHDEDEIFAKTESGFVFVASTNSLPGDMGPDMSQQEVANARLIAAAPDLLEALILARDLFVNSDSACAEICDAAILKATGSPR